MHGGDIYSAQVAYDFSVNLNPLGIPDPVKQAYYAGLSTVSNYPDPDCRSLRTELARKLRLGGSGNLMPDDIVCGNGASELLPAILRARIVRKALLVAPCFTGYERALSSVGADIDYFFLSEEDEFAFGDGQVARFLQQLERSGADVVILTNPNNPNGALMDRSILETIASACAKARCLLVIDECFMELTGKSESCSFVSLVGAYPQVVVLRAFTKTFAIPGLRLGYLVCSDAVLANAIRLQLPEWNVSTVAQLCGEVCLQEGAFVQRAVDVIAEERGFLSQQLQGMGYTVFDSDVNFILFKSSRTDVKERLLEKGILIRDCRDYTGLGQGFYRIAVLDHAANLLLVEALAALEDSGEGEAAV